MNYNEEDPEELGRQGDQQSFAEILKQLKDEFGDLLRTRLQSDRIVNNFNGATIKYFLNIISPNNDMKAKVKALLSAYPSIDVAAMGFPRGWECEPLWQLPAICKD